MLAQIEADETCSLQHYNFFLRFQSKNIIIFFKNVTKSFDKFKISFLYMTTMISLQKEKNKITYKIAYN